MQLVLKLILSQSCFGVCRLVGTQCSHLYVLKAQVEDVKFAFEEAVSLFASSFKQSPMHNETFCMYKRRRNPSFTQITHKFQNWLISLCFIPPSMSPHPLSSPVLQRNDEFFFLYIAVLFESRQRYAVDFRWLLRLQEMLRGGKQKAILALDVPSSVQDWFSRCRFHSSP